MQLYFLEIKNRLTLAFILQVATLLSLYYYKVAILFIMISPTISLGDSLHNFIFTGVSEPLSVYLILAYFIGGQIMAVYIVYQLVFFLSPGFYKLELKRFFSFVRLSTFCWVTSSIVANVFLIPWSWLFFLDFYKMTYGIAFNTHLEFRLLEYLKFYTSFHWINFLYFQFVGSLFFLLNSHLMTQRFIQNSRKITLFAFFCISASVCPDAISQLMFAGFLTGAYEFTIVVKLLHFRQPVKSH